MKQIVLRTLKWLGLALGAAVIALAAYVFRTWDRTWDAPLPDLHASADPAAIARGEYLIFGPAHCVECHTESNEAYERYAQTGERPPLMGGVKFPAPPLGAIYSKNITPESRNRYRPVFGSANCAHASVRGQARREGVDSTADAVRRLER